MNFKKNFTTAFIVAILCLLTFVQPVFAQPIDEHTDSKLIEHEHASKEKIKNLYSTLIENESSSSVFNVQSRDAIDQCPVCGARVNHLLSYYAEYDNCRRHSNCTITRYMVRHLIVCSYLRCPSKQETLDSFEELLDTTHRSAMSIKK